MGIGGVARLLPRTTRATRAARGAATSDTHGFPFAGSDENRSGTNWDDLLGGIAGMDLAGKPCAVFGLGDSAGYGDYFCDAIEEVHRTFASAGCKMVGSVSADDYNFGGSKSEADGKFMGCPFDEDNEGDKTEARAANWAKQLEEEMAGAF